MKKYVFIWLKIALNTAQETFVNRVTNLLFMLGKALRFGLFLVLLYAFQDNLSAVGGYKTEDLIPFFLIFNLIDTTAQCLYRGVYLFQQQVRRGEFDFDLMRPINPLFRSLFGKPDINDAIFLIPITLISLYLMQTTIMSLSITDIILFVVLFINGLIIATAFHILTLSLGIVTAEVDNVIMVYRDLSNFGRFPIDIYTQTVRFILTFIIPIGVMLTVPAQVITKSSLLVTVPVALLIGIVFLLTSLTAWKYALRQYSSASS